jgi:hypothetical protein
MLLSNNGPVDGTSFIICWQVIQYSLWMLRQLLLCAGRCLAETAGIKGKPNPTPIATPHARRRKNLFASLRTPKQTKENGDHINSSTPEEPLTEHSLYSSPSASPSQSDHLQAVSDFYHPQAVSDFYLADPLCVTPRKKPARRSDELDEDAATEEGQIDLTSPLKKRAVSPEQSQGTPSPAKCNPGGSQAIDLIDSPVPAQVLKPVKRITEPAPKGSCKSCVDLTCDSD